MIQIRHIRIGLALIGVAGAALLAGLMLQITAQYVPIRLDAAFLKLKGTALAYPYYAYVFFAHVFVSIIVMLVGTVQFVPMLRARWPGLHRVIGRVYVGLILGVAAPTGFVMALHANGGWIAQVAFVTQAVLWFWFTLSAVTAIRRGDIVAHRHHMLRSYALTLSAVSLRLLKWGIVWSFAPPPMDTYRLVAWLGWALNLGLVEIWLLRERSSLPLAPSAPNPVGVLAKAAP